MSVTGHLDFREIQRYFGRLSFELRSKQDAEDKMIDKLLKLTS